MKDIHTNPIEEALADGKADIVDAACEYLYSHLYTRRDADHPSNHYVASKDEMITLTEFVESFRDEMRLWQDASE